jgi:hypothetical protein
MGFSFRKSIGLGPIRLNLSKSGVGVSTGVKGARISTGPSGTKVYGGWGPFRYQKQLAPGIGAVGPGRRGGWGIGTVIMLIIVAGVWAYTKYYKPAHAEKAQTTEVKSHKATGSSASKSHKTAKKKAAEEAVTP